jgi:hypothetical protein
MPVLPFVLCAGLGLSVCTGMNHTQLRTLTGAGAGAAGGAIVGAIAGNAGLGAVIGAGTGAAGGYLFDKHKKAEQRSHAEDHMAGQLSKPR